MTATSRDRPPFTADEEGAAAPVVLGLAVALVLLSLVLVVAGHMVLERRRAAAGADLAALAGAVELQHGREACPAARESAARNEVALTSCRVQGERVRVSTAVTLRLLGRDLRVGAHAHAGPVGAVDPVEERGQGASARSQSLQQHLQQPARLALVEGVVAVAALG